MSALDKMDAADFALLWMTMDPCGEFDEASQSVRDARFRLEIAVRGLLDAPYTRELPPNYVDPRRGGESAVAG